MARVGESNAQFERRKVDHLRLALDPRTEAFGRSGLDSVHLVHEALPDLNFENVGIGVRSLGLNCPTPFLISSMTAGHGASPKLNRTLSAAAARHGWRMGVGSQRRELGDPDAAREWAEIRKRSPKCILFGNLGLAQVIATAPGRVQALVGSLGARALIVHLNPLQECLQPEGTPKFRGGLKALERLVRALDVPVLIKETGCGISTATVKRLAGVGVAAIDVAGFGGTHWGRIEGHRGSARGLRARAAVTFADWGIPTVRSLLDAPKTPRGPEIWASGGVRSGLDAAKLLAMGANTVGLAKPVLAAAMEGEDALDRLMERIAFELKVALFCTGRASIKALRAGKAWEWRET